MPLKLIPPRPGKSPNYTVRGTYHGSYVDRTTGTPVRSVAQKFLEKWKAEIDRGAYAQQGGPTFVSAAVAYIKAGGESRFLGKIDKKTHRWTGLVGHFGNTPLSELTQEAIDEAAIKLYPDASPATRNRQVHTVISAVLKQAGVDAKLKRPKGSSGSKRTMWLTPAQAFALFQAADQKNAEFGLLIRVITYTGMRLGEALSMEVARVYLQDAFAYVAETKNEDPRAVHLPPVIVSALANHPRGMDRQGQDVFRFSKCGRTYTWLKDACEEAGIHLPPRTGFHLLRHTWATWMRRYAGLDTRGLLGTGAWKDEKSVQRYTHVVASEESQQADFLPTPKSKIRGKSVEGRKKQRKING